MPMSPESISAATITSHAVPMLSRSPVSTYGSVCGSRILRRYRARENRNTFATVL